MLRPHDHDPLALFASVPPWSSFTASREGSPVWRPLNLDVLLAEPADPRDPLFLPCVAARLAAVSVGPLLHAAQGPRQARLELARVPAVDCGGDLDAARAAFWPALPDVRRLGLGFGSPAPALVLVGERDPYGRLPFFAKSGVWLFRALRLLGWDELACYATNALSTEQHPRPDDLRALHAAFGRYEPVWLALGNVAAEALRNVGIAHVAAQHPIQHRRFKFKDGPESFATILREAGLPTGPHFPLGLPAVPAEGAVAPDALPAFFELPTSVAFRRDSEKSKRTRLAKNEVKVDPRVVEAARRAYVLGDARTPRAAAREVVPEATASVLAGIALQARKEKWDEERAAHLARVREVAKDAAAVSEAKAAVSARRLAWEATTRSLQKLVEQLKNPETVVRAQDVKAIGDFAVTLSDRGDTTADAAREELGKLSLAQLAAKLSAAEGTLFGETKPEEAKRGGAGEPQGKPSAGDAG